ncbi:MAG TPA: hypothetical protein VFB29_04805 [Pseudolabrys sp.]|nr:hypothetical protein [Pseudolabrys sp.]
MRALKRDILGLLPPVKPAAINSRLHTIELFAHTPPAGFRSEIERCLGRKITITPCRDKSGYVHGYRAIINDPPLAVLPVLQRIVDANNDVSVHRVDIALDYKFLNEVEAQLWRIFLNKHVLLKWPPRNARRSYVGDSEYFVHIEAGSKRPRRNGIIYPKEGGLVVRFELRFLGSGPVRRAGLAEPKRLARINPAEKFERHVRVASIKPSMLKRLLRKSRAVRRARTVIERLTIQEFIDGRRRPERLLLRHPISILNVPRRITEWAPQVITHKDGPALFQYTSAFKPLPAPGDTEISDHDLRSRPRE